MWMWAAIDQGRPVARQAWLGRTKPHCGASPRSDVSQFRHFPFWRKRFMVPRDFAAGKVILFMIIKGLAKSQDLWRAV
jgi:hypothetical protein